MARLATAWETMHPFRQGEEDGAGERCANGRGKFFDMKLGYKVVCSAALVSTAALIAFSRPEKVPSLREMSAWTKPSYSMANGLRVHVFPSKSDQLTEAMGMQEWKFGVTVPHSDPPQLLFRQLEIRSRGKVIGHLSGNSGSLVKERVAPLRIALLPEGGPLRAADRITRVEQMEFGGAVSSATGHADNPFKDCTSLASGTPVLRDDGTFLLMAGNRTGSATWSTSEKTANDVELVLRMELRPSRPYAAP